MKEIWINVLESLGLAWWVEVVTSNPACTYYFGPFRSSQSAKAAKPGYVEDLEQEGAQGFQIVVKRCKPTHLTIFEESSASQVRRVPVAVSRQS
jgi:Domain of unknown function (DUF1816)